MTNTRKLLLMVILVSGIFVLPLAYAEDNNPNLSGHKTFWHKTEGKMCDIYNQLNLTDQQKKQLDENRNKYREQNKALFNQMKEKRTLIRQELQKDKLDMNKINQANNELKKIEGQLSDSKLQSMLETRKILTPEQFKKLTAKKEELFEHHMKGKYGWMANKRHIRGKNEMLTTQDGGVIVMKGDKLYKYDKDLNMTKEVKIKKEEQQSKSGMENTGPQETQEESGE